MPNANRYALCVLILVSLVLKQIGFADTKIKNVVKKGDVFPQLSFASPPSTEDRSYLGINSVEQFSIEDINADVLMLEIMHVNCSNCQRQAPINKQLFHLIESSGVHDGRIKMLSIAVGAKYRVITNFREYFKTPYPIIADPDFMLHKALGKTPAPLSLYIVRKIDGKLGIVADTHYGTNPRYEKTFEKLKRLLKVVSRNN